MVDEWPPSWYELGMRQKILDFLVALDIPGIHKKYAFMGWCERVGTRMTREEALLLLGPGVPEAKRGVGRVGPIIGG